MLESSMNRVWCALHFPVSSRLQREARASSGSQIVSPLTQLDWALEINVRFFGVLIFAHQGTVLDFCGEFSWIKLQNGRNRFYAGNQCSVIKGNRSTRGVNMWGYSYHYRVKSAEYFE